MGRFEAFVENQGSSVGVRARSGTS